MLGISKFERRGVNHLVTSFNESRLSMMRTENEDEARNPRNLWVMRRRKM